jgi:hypothetical protein
MTEQTIFGASVINGSALHRATLAAFGYSFILPVKAKGRTAAIKKAKFWYSTELGRGWVQSELTRRKKV